MAALSSALSSGNIGGGREGREKGVRWKGRWKGVISFCPEARLHARDIEVYAWGLNVRSKGYRFEMRRWVLTYPYPHPRPPVDLLGASYPNTDIRSAGKQLLCQHERNPRPAPTPGASPSVSLGGSNPRQERPIEVTLAKTNPGSNASALPYPDVAPFPTRRLENTPTQDGTNAEALSNRMTPGEKLPLGGRGPCSKGEGKDQLSPGGAGRCLEREFQLG